MPKVDEKPKAMPAAKSADLEARVAALESEVASLKTVARPQDKKAYRNTFGAMPDDAISRDAEKLGRAYRRRRDAC